MDLLKLCAHLLCNEVVFDRINSDKNLVQLRHRLLLSVLIRVEAFALVDPDFVLL